MALWGFRYELVLHYEAHSSTGAVVFRATVVLLVVLLLSCCCHVWSCSCPLRMAVMVSNRYTPRAPATFRDLNKYEPTQDKATKWGRL